MNLYKDHTEYMPQLDGLRAVAVAIVILSHWAPNMSMFSSGSYLGVHLFFILSGFLITGILLDAKKTAEFHNTGRSQIIKNFYIRRFLRIFPLYYLVLAIMFAFGVPNIVEHFSWHISYLTNFKIALDGWLGEASHLWSLAVEEQFYLFWPFVILLIPSRYLNLTIASFILVSPLFKTFYGIYGDNTNLTLIYTTPFVSFMALGSGSLLSVLQRKNINNQKLILIFSFVTSGLVLIILAITDYMYIWYGIIYDITTTICIACIIMCASKGYKGFIGTILECKPMVYLGKISYGIYLLHNFTPYLISQYLNHIGFPPLKTFGPYGLFLINSIALLLIASLSWYLLENKINSFKKLFPYVNKVKSLGPEIDNVKKLVS
jgi:peptidoglycan/LPS O-acetylase OafA/YrhL